tara:strand:+ start:1617 stop:2123 length:507 start_codon:yes stop_codon:yes gene_type:complete
MKIIIQIFIIGFFINSYSQVNESNCTTVYLIRHAEKVRDNSGNRNPNLNLIGLKRAEKWKEIFKNIDFDAIFSTDLNRTIQTALPISNDKKIEIQTYKPSSQFYGDFLKLNMGKTVLVVGHSNTTPKFVNSLIENDFYSQIDDNNNGNLYYVQKCGLLNANHMVLLIN